MSERFHIVGISGSLRKHSHNTQLLHNAAALLPEDFRFTLADISALPLYNQDLESELPEAVKQFAELLHSGSGFLISSPEYNGQLSGALKNALDWASRPALQTPLALKPVALMGATPGMGGTGRAQVGIRSLLFALNMDAVNRPEFLLPQSHTKFDDSGALTDPMAQQIMQQLVDNLVTKIKKHAEEQ
ncbi:chromate reductase [Paenibacillus rhizosphaerae]|uniref:Chromate reductase n=1 Tax=Paenibacillus rhizosphaerae TaxID=297318 RepID=A0A839TTH6_9BACL|nr:NAD(P)H-dependent oxidoreductase [Paenibacillus rhizosphaerae]MBB3130374.1 chromate reductase [Paenibacillus rhizosphaerae]